MEKLLSTESILSELRKIVASLLGENIDKIDITESIFKLGADSVIVMQFLRQIEKIFSVKITMSLIFNELSTIEKISEYIIDLLSKNQSAESNSNKKNYTPTDPPNQKRMKERCLNTDNSITQEDLFQIFRSQIKTMTNIFEKQINYLESTIKTSSKIELKPNLVLEKKFSVDSPASPFITKVNNSLLGYNLYQQEYLKNFIKKYIDKTSLSKLKFVDSHKVHADNRATAGFRLETKEIQYPIFAARSQGAYFEDIDGNKFVDLSMGFGVNLFGNSPSFVIKAVCEQAQLSLHIGPPFALSTKVACLIQELTKTERVALVNTGTEAIMIAMRLVRTVNKKDKIVLFTNSYHGHYSETLALKGIEPNLPSSVAPGIPDNIFSNIILLEYNDQNSLNYIKENAAQIAGVFIEPVRSRSPDIQPVEFLKDLRKTTRDYEIALVFDEIITGFRIHQSGAQAYFDIEADIVTYGKIIGGGMPIGVVAGKKKYLDAVDGGQWDFGDDSYPKIESTFFAGTFLRHPFAMSAAYATLLELKKQGPQLQENLNNKTDIFTQKINAFFSKENIPIKIVNFGSLFRFQSKFNLDIFYYHLILNGVYVWEGRTCFLSTEHSEKELEIIFQAISKSALVLQKIGLLGDENLRLTSNLPLSLSQKQYLFPIHCDKSQFLFCREGPCLRIKGLLHKERIRDALKIIAQRHDALRIIFNKDNYNIYSQTIRPEVTTEMNFLDLMHFAPDIRYQEANIYLYNIRSQNLIESDTVAVTTSLIKLDDNDFILSFIADHALVDGKSWLIFLSELTQLYNDPNSILKVPAVSFKESILLEKRLDESHLNDKMIWWKSYLDGFFNKSIISPEQTNKIPPIGIRLGLSSSLNNNSMIVIENFCKQQCITPTIYFLAIISLLMNKMLDKSDFLIGISSSGRTDLEEQGSIGCYSFRLPIRILMNEAKTVSEFLILLKKMLADIYDNQEAVSLGLTQNIYHYNSIYLPFEAMINVDKIDSNESFNNTLIQIYPQPIIISNINLNWNISISHNRNCLIECHYNQELYNDSIINTMLKNFNILSKRLCLYENQNIQYTKILDHNINS